MTEKRYPCKCKGKGCTICIKAGDLNQTAHMINNLAVRILPRLEPLEFDSNFEYESNSER